MPEGLEDALLARARVAAAEKTARGVYDALFRSRLAEPLDIRPDPSFAAGPAWDAAQCTATVTADPAIVSTRPVVGPAIRLLKRLVRRGLRWYLGPVTAQVSAHNQAVVEVLTEHNRQIVVLRRQVDGLRRRVAALELELDRTEGPARPPA